jgi:acetyl-CoA synthetase
MQGFLEARDLLRKYGSEYKSACREFRWPDLDSFNWALDYFDAMAKGNHRVALHVVDDAGSEEKLTFAELSERSNRVANVLRAAGVRRGDRILIMLGNVVPLWEITLAAIKLGAVFSPATAMLTTGDLQDRIDRGEMRHVIVEASSTAKFDDVKGTYTRIIVGGSRDGWLPYTGEGQAEFAPEGNTRASDPMLLYFTSGTTAKPKMVLHTHASYPIGHLSTMYWIGVQEGDVHWNISSPGWAKHAWSSFFAPWNAGATIFVFNYARFDARRVLAAIRDHAVATLCAPPTVWRMLILENLGARPHA